MPKHKHTRDKLYYTQEEMRIKYYKNKKKENNNYFLPFNYCCVSLRPLNTCKNICCDRDGNLYNKYYLLSYVTKFHKNPITGKKKVSMKDIITLNIAQDNSGNFICPITLKVLNNSIKIIAIPETGNVYSYMAYQELNLSMNNFKDLKSDIPFDKKNVIILNDPQKRKIVKNFYFQNVEIEKDYMNKLVNNKIDLNLDENNLIDYKYQKIVNDIENDENKEDKIKALKDNNLIYEEEEENNLNKNNKNNNKEEIEGYDEYLILKEKINIIIDLIKKKNLLNNNIYLNNDLDMDLYKSMLELNYAGFYCFMVKENLWKKYFKLTDLNTITHTDNISKNNKMSITSTFFSAKGEKNILKKNGIPLFTELKEIYYPIIKRQQLKTYMILKTNLGKLNIELWSTRLTETVEKIYEILSENLNKVNKINYMTILDDEFLVLNDINFDVKIEKDKKVSIDKNIIKGPYVGYMVTYKKVCFFTNKNNYINKSDIYIIGTIFNKDESNVKDNNNIIINENNEENILNIYFDEIKKEKKGDIIIEKVEMINNPYIDTMKDILFKEIKEKYLISINNDEINNDIKIMKQLEKTQNEIDEKKSKNKSGTTVGKYLNQKRNSSFNIDKLQKFMNSEC